MVISVGTNISTDKKFNINKASCHHMFVNEKARIKNKLKQNMRKQNFRALISHEGEICFHITLAKPV